MAENPSNIKQEMEMSMAAELAPESHEQSQEFPMTEEMLQRRNLTLPASRQQQKLDSNSTGSAAGQPILNMMGTLPKKARTQQLQTPTMSSGQGREADNPQEYRGSFQGRNVHYECNPQADLIAEVGLEMLNRLEMEIIRQMYMLTERLCALEDQVTIWRYKGALFFTMLMSACAINLWLWTRH